MFCPVVTDQLNSSELSSDKVNLVAIKDVELPSFNISSLSTTLVPYEVIYTYGRI